MDRLLELLEARDYPAAWTEFQRLRPERPDDPVLLLRGSHAAFGLRRLDAARTTAQQALDAFRSEMPGPLLGKIRFHLGMVAREQGDTTEAYLQFSSFLSELPLRYPALAPAEGKARFYLALTLRQRGDLADAVREYRRVIEVAQAQDDGILTCQALHNVAWVYCLLGRPTEARAALERSRGLVIDAEGDIHQQLGEAYLVATEGHHVQALSLCESLMRRAERGEPVTAEERSQTTWIMAGAALALGDTDRAWALSGVALTAAVEAEDARLMVDVMEIRRQIVTAQRGA